MAHPQNSPRGLFAKAGIDVGAQSLTSNSTSVNFEAGIKISNQASGLLTSNSTGVNFPGSIFLTGQAVKGKIYANSTAILLPSTGFQMAALTSLKVTSNSTGILIGARYISTNTTGNATT